MDRALFLDVTGLFRFFFYSFKNPGKQLVNLFKEFEYIHKKPLVQPPSVKIRRKTNI